MARRECQFKRIYKNIFYFLTDRKGRVFSSRSPQYIFLGLMVSRQKRLSFSGFYTRRLWHSVCGKLYVQTLRNHNKNEIRKIFIVCSLKCYYWNCCPLQTARIQGVVPFVLKTEPTHGTVPQSFQKRCLYKRFDRILVVSLEFWLNTFVRTCFFEVHGRNVERISSVLKADIAMNLTLERLCKGV